MGALLISVLASLPLSLRQGAWAEFETVGREAVRAFLSNEPGVTDDTIAAFDREVNALILTREP